MMRTLKWSLFLLLFCFAAGFVAQAQKVMGDPLFGIAYDPQKAHFEQMPPLLTEKCARLHGRYVAAWVYGHFKTDDSEYFVISGLMEFHEDKAGAARTIAPEEGDGLIVALRGPQCLVDQADYFFDQGINPAKNATPIIVPTSVLTGILQDAFERCSIAFGGRQECLKRAHPDAIGPPFIRKQLEAFRKDSGTKADRNPE